MRAGHPRPPQTRALSLPPTLHVPARPPAHILTAHTLSRGQAVLQGGLCQLPAKVAAVRPTCLLTGRGGALDPRRMFADVHVAPPHHVQGRNPSSRQVESGF